MDPTQVPSNSNLDALFREKGELMTQLEIVQDRLRNINMQLAQILNTKPIVPQSK